jgi:hypothetical protein
MDSQYFTAGALLAVLAAAAVACVVSVFIGGALLQLSVRWVEKATPGYWRCVGAIALGYGLGAALQFVLASVLAVLLPAMASVLPTAPWSAGLILSAGLGLALSVLVLALAVVLVVPGAEGRRIPFPRACAASTLTSLLGLAIYAAVVAVLMLALGGVPGVSR